MIQIQFTWGHGERADVEWPLVPRVGELVSIEGSNGRVVSVAWVFSNSVMVVRVGLK